ncbi:hypothetical protein HY407_00635 [Candidatus Gottesmanbacteria bacterium]|nr:hypothetical protein [Candidatus Gottesmanbacteria bacterium]
MVVPLVAVLLFAGVVYLLVVTADPEVSRKALEFLKTPQPMPLGVK